MHGSKFIVVILAAVALMAIPQVGVTAPRTKTSTLKISGTPPTTVMAGTLYSFTPTISGGGSTKSYAISNKPVWASFSISTGKLVGTPGATQVGSYSNVTISVTDGITTASLSPFSISVTAPAPVLGNAVLSWIAPSQNTDGSMITDIAGYNVYYGTSPGSLTNKIVLANPTASTYTIGNLSTGTYYFAVSAYNLGGIESALSNIGSKTIP